MPTDRLDWLNAGLMLVCWTLAYCFPVELLLVSYAALGPAHYLTEISWLHDRDYFATNRLDALPLAALAGLAMLKPGALGAGCLWAAFAYAFSAAFLPAGRLKLLTGLSAAAAGFCLGPRLGFFWTTMLPTAAHVFLFTALFVAAGARKRASAPGFLSLAVLLACGASFFFYHPFATYPLPSALRGHMRYFMGVDGAILARFGISGFDRTIGVMGFLSFAYTYHYLNWFSKAEVIRWHRTPKSRWAMMAGAYAAMLAVFAWDFDAGFWASSVLSMAHVALEFPLDLRTAAGLVRAPAPGV